MNTQELVNLHGVAEAAKILGVDRGTIYRRIKREATQEAIDTPAPMQRGFSFDLEALDGVGSFQQKLDSITGYANTCPLILVPFLDKQHPFSKATDHYELCNALSKLRQCLNAMYQYEGIEKTPLVFDMIYNQTISRENNKNG